MKSIDYLTAQAQLAKTMRRVCENEEPITIDGAGKDCVVMMPLDAFNKIQSGQPAVAITISAEQN